MAESGIGTEIDTFERDVSSLDVVDSQWWYWIAIHPIVVLVSIPVAVSAIVYLLLAPVVIRPELHTIPLIGAELGGLLLGLVLFTSVLAVILPIAFYMDAYAVRQSGADWAPDPHLYAFLGVLQVVATPLLGIVVAIYYLFRRHQHVGVP